MASIKYDVSDVEAGGGEAPQPGLYKGKIASATHRTKKSDGTAVNDLEVVVRVSDNTGTEYAPLWTYVKLPGDPSFEQSKWKLRELTDAVGLPAKGAIDPKHIEGKPVTVKVSADTNLDGEYRGRVKNLLKPGSVDGAAPSGEGDEEPLTREELENWETDDLKTELMSRDIKVAGRFTKDKAIDAILENQEGDGVQDEPEDEAEDEDFDIKTVEGFEDFDEWATDDLKEYVKENEITIAGRSTEGKLRAAIIEYVSSNGAAAPAEAEEEAPTDDYDEWEEQELLDEVNTRNESGAEIKITGRKTKDKLIAALREDDKSAEPF